MEKCLLAISEFLYTPQACHIQKYTFGILRNILCKLFPRPWIFCLCKLSKYKIHPYALWKEKKENCVFLFILLRKGSYKVRLKGCENVNLSAKSFLYLKRNEINLGNNLILPSQFLFRGLDFDLCLFQPLTHLGSTLFQLCRQTVLKSLQLLKSIGHLIKKMNILWRA